jgi:hypothetical protein
MLIGSTFVEIIDSKFYDGIVTQKVIDGFYLVELTQRLSQAKELRLHSIEQLSHFYLDIPWATSKQTFDSVDSTPNQVRLYNKTGVLVDSAYPEYCGIGCKFFKEDGFRECGCRLFGILRLPSCEINRSFKYERVDMCRRIFTHNKID